MGLYSNPVINPITNAVIHIKMYHMIYFPHPIIFILSSISSNLKAAPIWHHLYAMLAIAI